MPQEDPVLTSSRREMLVAFGIWLTATVYSLSYCGLYGYNRDPASLKFVFGFPDWIFWGVVFPWGLCTVASGIFAFGFMRDEDLGDPHPEESDG
ncbi:DUF997 family protein [Planctellipticum variicoloris]|uniref:DUF997 family protein n=1 Tax=Planctellipticum variicoloris TaxID=3064265 RepID=UPI0030140F19|nr:YhdT family protein [Planctomycetaceae bacterium SH412]